MKPIRLCELCAGQTGRIIALTLPQSMAARLTDLGLFVGAEVCCVAKGGKGGLQAFGVGGATVAMRKEDAQLVWVQPKGGEA